MTARSQVPPTIRRGEVITVRLLIQHPMETGYRRDDTGDVIARNTIRTVRCLLAGREVFRADLSSGISANPYLQFPLRAEQSGVLEFSWIDDAEVHETHTQVLTVID